jgi:ABC-2 type transport system ATP-binding protein
MTKAETPQNGRPLAVELCGLEKSFRAPQAIVRAVAGLSVSIGVGEIVALLGPNGAGKSTTIDMLLGFSEPDAGTVSVFGRPPAEAIAGGTVGVMLQTGALVRDLSVRELIAMVASLYAAPLDVDETLELVGIEAIAGRRTQKLSGGEVQRVRFALALIGDPRLLVLDEPTVGMDVSGRRAFWSAMRAHSARGTTELFATHYLEESDANADRAVMIAAGRVVADGATTEIRARVGTRTIRATLPGVDAGALAGLPGVVAADRRGDVTVLTCADGDAAIRALIAAHPEARDIEIAGAGIEQAFVELTREEALA